MFIWLDRNKLERVRRWPVLMCHWMNNRWLSLVHWEERSHCLHWWVSASTHRFFRTDAQRNISLERSLNPVHNQKLIFLLSLHGQHPHRKEERCFVPYKAPPEDGSAAEVEEFLEHAKFITEDLEWLLSLPHDKFWCQVSACQSVNGVIGNFNILSF